jgi:peroxidase
LFKEKQIRVSYSTERVEEMASNSKALFFFALLSFLAVSLRSAFADSEEDPGLVMNFYKDASPQAEDIIKEQVRLLYKRHKKTTFSWLRNIFHDCGVQVSSLSL